MNTTAKILSLFAVTAFIAIGAMAGAATDERANIAENVVPENCLPQTVDFASLDPLAGRTISASD